MKIFYIFIIIIGAFCGYRKLFMDYCQQRELVRIINARKKRVETCKFRIENYIENKLYLKKINWLKQKDIVPTSYKLNNKFKVNDYSKGCKYVLNKKGL